MSDTAAQNTAPITPTTPTAVGTAAAETPAKANVETPEQTIAGLRAALAKANAEAKDNRLKAAELDEVKKSQMSDLEKAQTTAQEFQKAAEQAKSEASRWRIAAKYGISDEDAETFLTATDEAALIKQAERLAAMKPEGPTTPRPDRTQGGSGQPPALNSDGLEQALMSKLGI